MTADTSLLPKMDRPKSTSTLNSSNALPPTVWSVIAPNVSNATSSLTTSSMNLQGCATYVSWKTVFSAKHSLLAGSVMKIQATSSTALQGSAKPVCSTIAWNAWICKNVKSVIAIMGSTKIIKQENASIAKSTYAWTARVLLVVSSVTKQRIISSTLPPFVRNAK